MLRKPLILLLAIGFCACTGELYDERTLDASFELDRNQHLRIELPAVSLEVVATERPDVGVELTAGCRWQVHECKRAVERVEIVSRRTSRRLTLAVEGTEGWSGSMVGLEGRIQMPLSAELEIEAGGGTVEVYGIQSSASIDLGAGEVRLETGVQAVGEAFLAVDIGRSRLSAAGERIQHRRAHLIGSRVGWEEGPGAAEIDVRVGVGKATVRLE